MVHSKLHKEIQYKETYAIDAEDIGFETSIYEIELFGQDTEIALGKPKYEYSNKHVIYFPIYLLIDEDPVSKIGIYEIRDHEMIQSIDEDDDFFINEKNVLIYIKKDYYEKVVQRYNGKKKSAPQQQPTTAATPTNQPPTQPLEDDVFTLNIPPAKQSAVVKQADDMTKNGIFINNPHIPTTQQPLPEETNDDAQRLKREFKEGPRNTWIQNFMKNENYALIDNEAGGDCFFAVIREAFRQIGKETHVEKLRAILAKEATEDVFQQYRTLYTMFLAEFQENEKKLKSIKDNSKIIKKRITQSSDKTANAQLLEEAKKLVVEYKEVEREISVVREHLQEFGFMKDITTLEKFREILMTKDYWADTWAISTLERLLNIKIIIFSEQTYRDEDYDSVLKCGQLNDSDLERQGNYKPDFYVLTAYKNNNHYLLVTYKERNIFKFAELPFGVKSLVVNKCLEKNAGPYYLIEDFRVFKTKLGLPANEGEYESDTEENIRDIDLYDKEIVFQFYAKSDSKQKAGKGSNEKIPDVRVLDFTDLNKIANWRRMLDDTWPTKFEVDGKIWQTVEHYMLGAQFRKGFPNFYREFSLDSNSEISKDLELARIAGQQIKQKRDIVHKNVKLRDKAIEIDADFYEVRVEPRHVQERALALRAKYTQNIDLKNVLRLTKNAKLVHFIRSKPAEPDFPLMRLRQRIFSA